MTCYLNYTSIKHFVNQLVSTNVYIEWLGVPIMVSSARVRGVDHLHKSGRVLARGQILGARQRSHHFIRNCASIVGLLKSLFKYEENHEVSMLYSLSLWFNRL